MSTIIQQKIINKLSAIPTRLILTKLNKIKRVKNKHTNIRRKAHRRQLHDMVMPTHGRNLTNQILTAYDRSILKNRQAIISV